MILQLSRHLGLCLAIADLPIVDLPIVDLPLVDLPVLNLKPAAPAAMSC